MPEETKQQPEAVKNVGHRFQPGHQKYGGRKKRSTQEVRAMADKYGADPIEFLLKTIASDTVFEVQIVDGKKTRVEVPVTLAMKMDACRIVAGYMYAKLSTTQITGKDEGPVEVATLDLSAILANPNTARAAVELAMQLTEAQQVGTLHTAPVDVEVKRALGITSPDSV